MKSLKRTIIGLLLSVTMMLNATIVTFAANDINYITDEKELYSIIREAFVERDTDLTIYYSQKGDLDEDYFGRWIEGALQETGEPDEGDYLRKHLGRTGGSGSGWYDSTGMYYYTFNLEFEYYTTKEQEDAVEDEVDRVFDELGIDSLESDYEKVVTIYDYICDNVTYDYANLENDTYDLKYSAYAALINKTSVCQGYSNLLYYMLHEADIDSRIITGTGNGGGHAWNIVELNNKYYYLDATWDAVWDGKYFLKGTTDFGDHVSDAEYLTETFLAKYPIPATGYVPCTGAEHSYGEYISDENATCTVDGTKTAICENCGVTDTILDEGSATGHEFEGCAGTDPTCTEPGYVEYACVKCWDESVTYREELPATGHEFEGCAGTDPTCTEPGYVEYACVKCWDESVTYREELPATGHEFEACMGTDPTCTESGFVEYACVKCWDESVTYRETIPETGHEWNKEFTVDKEATCEEAGSKSIHCANCEEVKDVTEIAKLDHTYGDWIVDAEATCTVAGLKHKECTGCEDVVTEAIAAGHEWNELFTIDKEATCKEAGSKSIHCANCEEVKDVTEIAKLDHTYGDWIVDAEATCTVAGLKHKECTGCEDVVTEAIAAGHEWNELFTIDKEATCKEAGSKSIHCVNCEEVKDVTEIAKLDHTYGDWIVDDEATCTVAGSKHKECAGCEDVVTEEIPASHAWDELFTIDKETTCKEAGSKSIHCANCEEVKDVTVIAKLDHAFGDWYTVEESTTTAKGYDQRDCQNCDAFETREKALCTWKKDSKGWYFLDGDGNRVCNQWVQDSSGYCFLNASGYMVYNKWCLDETGWAYAGSNGYRLTSRWIKDSTGWCYVDGTGYMVYNKWVKDSKGYCYVGETGYMVYNTWVTDENGQSYVGSDGYRAINKWVKDGTDWCYVGADGYKVANKWVKDSVGWCWLDETGCMVYNQWVADSKGLCYVGTNGYMVTNKWVKDSVGWCYVNASGYKVTNKWVKDSVGWCYVDESGYMVYEQWVEDSVGWCYVDESGYMVYSKWICIEIEDENEKEEHWYYVDASGYRVENQWKKIGSYEYYFKEDGVMAADEWIGNYYVNKDGAWVPNYVKNE